MGGAGGAGGSPWADWPMPNSAVDVAAGAPNPQSYTSNGDGTVTDNVTRLKWQQASPATTYTWSDALSYCATLTLGGINWRLPSIMELASIIDTGQANAAIDPTAFPATGLRPYLEP